MKIVVVPDYRALSQKAAEMVLRVLSLKPDSVFALPTGNTPIGLYEELVKISDQEKADLSKIKAFALDEYVGVPPEDEHSFGFFLRQRLIDKIQLQDRFDHLRGNAIDLFRECSRYEEAIKAAGGIDMAILGLGVNGHIAFNEPGTPFASRTHVVDLAVTTRDSNTSYFPDGFCIPDRGISMGIGTILAARQIMVLANGKSKAKIVSDIVRLKPTTKIPATALKTHDSVMLIVDEEAASQLDNI